MSRAQKMLRTAVVHHQAGRLSQAEALYRRIIAERPNEAHALHLLGLIVHTRGGEEEAEQWVRRAIAANGRPAAEFFNTLGTVLGAQGKTGDAARCYQEAIAHNPNYVAAHQNMGRVLMTEGRVEEAASHFEKALQLTPDDAAAHHDMAGALMKRNRPAEAIASLQRAVQLDPQRAESWNNLGNALRGQRRLAEATDCVRKALALQPGMAIARNNLGVLLQEQSKLARDAAMAAEAAECFENAVQLDPAYAEAWCNLGNARKIAGRIDEGIACVRKALDLQPGFAPGYSNLSAMLHDQGNLGEGLACAQKSVALDPREASAWSNLGNALKSQCRLKEAIACYGKAIGLDPGFVTARWNLSMALFMSGEIARGWEEFEWGLPAGQRMPQRPFLQPRWDGSPLAGRRLLIWGEQGIGDEIILAGMIPELGAGHILECEPRLAPLFARSFPAVEVVPRTDPPHTATAQADLQSPAGSLGRFLRPSLDRFPRHRGYLRADPERVAHWRRRLEELGPGLTAGICWRSAFTGGLRALACTDLLQWGPVLSVAGVHFINLQYGQCREELDRARATFGIPIHNLSGIDLKQDLDDLAALITALDLVVSVATSVADMAGALGKPTLVLFLTSVANWFTMGQDFAPWFPSERIYWRVWDRPWEPILQRVARDLAQLVAACAGPPPAQTLAQSPHLDG